MNFDNFDGIDIVDKISLLRNCKSAERNIMISPYNAIANSRAALEILCKGLIKKNNVEQIKPQPKICKNCNMPIEDTVNLPPNLATMIDTCLKEGLFTNEDAAALIRKNGNDTLHANKGAQKLHVVNAKNIEKAGSCVQALYTLFKEVFGQELLVPDFDLNKVPFGYYEIVRAVPKAPNEVICGDNNYFVKDPQENYYYFQVFHRNSMEERDNELGARGVLTGNKIKEDKGMGRVGFMKELRRLNVAFTRCQKQLVIVGDIDYLTQCMNMEALKDEGTEWPCAHQEETEIIDNDTINQCAECPAICERKFARFMRLLMQHVDAGAGNSFQSEDFFRRNA